MCKEERAAHANKDFGTTCCAQTRAQDRYEEYAVETRGKPGPRGPPRTCESVLADMVRVSEGTEGCDALKMLLESIAYVPPEQIKNRFWCGYGAQPGLQSICQTFFQTNLRVRELYDEAYRITVRQQNIH